MKILSPNNGAPSNFARNDVTLLSIGCKGQSGKISEVTRLTNPWDKDKLSASKYSMLY